MPKVDPPHTLRTQRAMGWERVAHVVGAFVQSDTGTIATLRYSTGFMGLHVHLSEETTVQRMAVS